MAAITACAITPDKNFIQILETLSEKLEQPFFITYTPYTFKCILIFTAAYFLGIGIYESQKRNYRRGVEHGSAKWGNVSEICRRYCEKQYTNNLLLTQHFRMGLDGLQKLMEMHGFTMENLCTFGDADNDYDMTLHAGVGVVMANGSEKTKSVADHITKDNDHDGIGVFLQEHLISRS